MNQELKDKIENAIEYCIADEKLIEEIKNIQGWESDKYYLESLG